MGGKLPTVWPAVESSPESTTATVLSLVLAPSATVLSTLPLLPSTLLPPLSTLLPPPLSTLESTLESTPESTLLESTPDFPPSTATTTATTTASVRLRPSPRLRLRLTLLCTPPESTLPSLPPPTPTALLPLRSALSPPLWFVPWLLLLSVLMCPPLWCPTLPPLSLLESTPDSPPSTATTTATTTASVRLRPSPRLTLL